MKPLTEDEKCVVRLALQKQQAAIHEQYFPAGRKLTPEVQADIREAIKQINVICEKLDLV